MLGLVCIVKTPVNMRIKRKKLLWGGGEKYKTGRRQEGQKRKRRGDIYSRIDPWF